MIRPQLVLFNGGFFAPAAARDRVVQALAAWFGEPPRVLTTNNLEAAVAVGAATYARLRAGIGPSMPLVKAGSGRAYYIGLRAPLGEDATPAVCVISRGTDEGTTIRLEHSFTVATNRPISFSLYSSTIRSDRAGDIVSLQPGDDAREHAPLVTVLRYGRKSRQVDLPVRLSVAFTEVGILELWCESQASEHVWRLHFQVRGEPDDDEDDPLEPDGLGRADPSRLPAGRSDDRPPARIGCPTRRTSAYGESAVAPTRGRTTAETAPADAAVPDDLVTAAERAIRSVFEAPGGEITPENLVAHVEQTIGFGKTAWPLAVMRRFTDVLIDVAAGRRTSASLEARWLNLFGLCFRPGFGAAKDPWRIGEARKIYAAGLAFPNAIQNKVEWLVLWQRVAGGFSTGQQRELAQRVIGELGLGGKKAARLNPQMERESWRLLASLERLDAAARVKIGDELVRRVRREAGQCQSALGDRTPRRAGAALRSAEQRRAASGCRPVARRAPVDQGDHAGGRGGDRADRGARRRSAARPRSGTARARADRSAPERHRRRRAPPARGSDGDLDVRRQPCVRRAAARWSSPGCRTGRMKARMIRRHDAAADRRTSTGELHAPCGSRRVGGS